MKKIWTLVPALLLTCFGVIAQDTITVQTLTYDSTGRDYMFEFPADDGTTYEKIVMEYSMRCKGALVSVPSDRNRGCGEWDYSCNTYIDDSTRVDSVPATHPSHIISGFPGDTYSFTTQPTSDYIRFIEKEAIVNSVSNEVEGTIAPGTAEPISILNNDSKSARVQYLYTSAELNSAGITGPISALSVNVTSGSGNLELMKIKLTETDENELTAPLVFADFEQAYFLDRDVNTGETKLQFYEPFDWDGSSNIVVEFSFTNEAATPTLELVGSETSEVTGMVSAARNNYLVVNGSEYVEMPTGAYESVVDEVTISVWTYGNENVLPKNTSIFEGVTSTGQRAVNVHLPWSNSQIYWDCGNSGGYDRINKTANLIDFLAKWNHWAFTKNTNDGTMKIYLNGELWHSGTGKNIPIDISRMNLASSASGTNLYAGKIDEFRIWNKELSADDIKDWMHRSIDESHPAFENLVSYYKLDEGQGASISDEVGSGNNGSIIGGASWRADLGEDFITNFTATKMRPHISFFQGNYDVSINDITKTIAIPNLSNQVTSYEVIGTDLEVSDVRTLWEARDEVVYDEEGDELETYPVASEGVIEVETLDYFNKLPARYEIMSFVTPYGIYLDLGEEGKTWTFDMTDFGPILKGNKRMFLGNGGQNQEEMDIKFHFIKGTPPREVMDIQQIWRPRSCNYTNIHNNSCFEPRDVPLADGASHYKIRSMITGHGQEGEFIPRIHKLDMNGSGAFLWEVWTECADNPVYPQGGTWIYDRAGWCPGAATDLYEWDLTPMVEAGETINLDYDMISGSGDTRYLVNHQLVTYGDYNFQTDGAIVDILNPTDKVEYARTNPGCQSPVVVLRNTGANSITTAEIRYQIGDGTSLTHAWEGDLASMETEEIELPVEDPSFWQAASGLTRFGAEIISINGSQDDYSQNDLMESIFTTPDIFNDEVVVLNFKTNNIGGQSTYKLKDFDGNNIINRTFMASNQAFKDSLELGPGCYTLEITDSGHNGLDFWATPGDGSGYCYLLGETGLLKTIDPDFGSGVKYTFAIGSITNVDAPFVDHKFQVFPNPTSGLIDILYSNDQGVQPLKTQVLDVTGKVIYERNLSAYAGNFLQIDLSAEPTGVYYAQLVFADETITRKVVKL